MDINESLPTAGLPTVRDVAASLEAWADPGFAASYDNVGLHIGRADRLVHSGLIALDLTPLVVEEARRLAVSMVITHHPLFFHPLRSMTASDVTGSMALQLAEAQIALYSAHTNLDSVPGGVSFCLASRLGIAAPQFLDPDAEGASGLGAVGHLHEPVTLQDFLAHVALRLEASGLRYAGSPEQMVHKVAVCGGAGAGLIQRARESGADVFVTADISYHRFFEVLEPGGRCAMALVDAGHYETERPTEALLCSELRTRFPQVRWMRTSLRTSPIQNFLAGGEL